MADYSELLESCRKNLGEAPRKFSWWTRLQLKHLPPLWMSKQPADPLWEQFRLEETLLKEGVLVWGHLVQANNLLFKPGPSDHPASIVISLDPEADEHPVRLSVLAEKIFAHKNTHPGDPDMAALSDNITDERDRDSVKVADKFTGLNDCHMLSVLVFRKDLPLRRITGGLFPVLVLPGNTKVTMILPCRFWDARLLTMHGKK